QLIAVTPAQLLIHDLQTGVQKQIDLETTVKSRPSCLALSPDGHSIVVGHGDGSVSLWDLNATGRVAWLCPAVEESPYRESSQVFPVAFSGEEKKLVTGTMLHTVDAEIPAYDMETKKPLGPPITRQNPLPVPGTDELSPRRK